MAYKGSMLQLQMYVNQYSDELDAAIAQTFELPASIEWVSPLSKRRYAEYRDDSFLRMLGLAEHQAELSEFWPSGGPCWDALGIARDVDGARVPLLVEAKSYPEEGRSSISAKSPFSINMIEAALKRTAIRCGLNGLPESWMKGRYQTANRLAHLYLLRDVLQIDARLVFVMIIEDPTHNPTTRGVWKAAWSTMWADMELEGPPPDTGVVYLPGRNRTPPKDSLGSGQT